MEENTEPTAIAGAEDAMGSPPPAPAGADEEVFDAQMPPILQPESPLYSDHRINTAPLPPAYQEIFDRYLQRLRDGEATTHDTTVDKWSMWDRFITNFYKELVFDVFKARLGRVPRQMELIAAGSLAKKQATMFSDGDFIAIFTSPEEAAAAREVFRSLNNLLYT